MTKETLFAGLLFTLAACGTAVPPAQTDPKIVADIAAACAGSGLFKAADGTLTAFVPQATLPVALINAGVDQVCADPAKYAADASTVEWLIKNIAAAKK